ncbi:hypothetical protein D3C80_1010090 [compost metagenome]
MLAAFVTATGIRGALGTSADAAKAANASEPRGVDFEVVELFFTGEDGLTG